MASADLVQTKGLGSSLVSPMKRLTAAYSSTIDVKTPRLSRCRVSSANRPATALAQEKEVGVKWPVQPSRHLGVFVGGVVVEHHVDRLVGII